MFILFLNFFNCIYYLSSISHIARLLTTIFINIFYFILFIISSYLYHPFIFNRCLLYFLFFSLFSNIIFHTLTFPSHIVAAYLLYFFPYTAHHPTQFILDRTLVRYPPIFLIVRISQCASRLSHLFL